MPRAHQVRHADAAGETAGKGGGGTERAARIRHKGNICRGQPLSSCCCFTSVNLATEPHATLSPKRRAARERQSAVERSIREEARRLRQGQGGGEAGGAGAAAAGRKNVDLESLAFVQGAHFNSSKQCTLPQVGGGRVAAGWCSWRGFAWQQMEATPIAVCRRPMHFLLQQLPNVLLCLVLHMQGSYRTVHKGYEEVHVPALKPKPFGDGALATC